MCSISIHENQTMTVQTWTQAHIEHACEKTMGPGQVAGLNRSVCKLASVQQCIVELLYNC